MIYICYNGSIIPASQPVHPADDRSYRYGDGLFETIRWKHGKPLLKELHFERLWLGLDAMEFTLNSTITPDLLVSHMSNLCIKNGCDENARIRLSFSRGAGGLFDDSSTAQYLIEAWPLENQGSLNENGLIIGVYHDARKNIDSFSHLKTANFLPYVMGARHARRKHWNEAIILNPEGRVCDTTTSNLFIVQGEKIFTPPLSEGCVDGVLRKYLIDKLQKHSTFPTLIEQNLQLSDLLSAEELFLTNAIHGIRWVREFDKKQYSNHISSQIFSQLLVDRG